MYTDNDENICSDCILTTLPVRGIIIVPNIGKDMDMDSKKEVKEEVLERVLTKLSTMSDDQLERLVRIASEQGIELCEKEPRG